MKSMNEKTVENRRQPRTKFVFPVRFDIFLPDRVTKSFDGYIRDMSMGGACVQFRDRYGLIDLDGLKGHRVKLAVRIPQGEQLYLNAVVQWARKENATRGYSVLLGLEIKEIAEWQVEQLERFISMGNKDQKMMWNLWECYMEDKRK